MVGSTINFEKAEYYFMSLQHTMDQFNSIYSDVNL